MFRHTRLTNTRDSCSAQCYKLQAGNQSSTSHLDTSHMESISLPWTLPEPLQQVHLAHFSNLDPATQSAAIIDRIITASRLPSASPEQAQQADAERAKLDFAFLDPTKLCSKLHLLSAVTQAAVVCARSWDDDRQVFREGEASIGGMKSKTPHSEVIYMLNPGNNVSRLCQIFATTHPCLFSLTFVPYIASHATRSENRSSVSACPLRLHRCF